MSIIIINGPAKSGKTLIANALRNAQISAKNGALLVDETQAGDPVHLIEKLLAGTTLTPGTPAGKLAFKPNPMVILVGKQAAMLEVFEKLVPGFTKAVGPTYSLTTAKG
jgi:hypothetical protein